MSDICTWPSCGHTAKGQCQPDKPVTVPDEAPALYAETIRQRRVIERLNAEVERLRTGHQGACYACEPVGELNIRLKAEVEWLRGALKGMLDTACAACDEDYVIRVTKREWDAHVKATDIARAALTQEKTDG